MIASNASALHLLGLAEFAQANPDRALLVVLPAEPVTQADDPDLFVKTLLYDEASCDGAGDVRLLIPVPHDLQLQAISFHDSAPSEGLRIRGIFCGDAPVFLHSKGVPVERFQHPALAGVMGGWKVRAGANVSVLASADGPARLAVSVTGLKRALPLRQPPVGRSPLLGKPPSIQYTVKTTPSEPEHSDSGS